jgi:hypothetical protein
VIVTGVPTALDTGDKLAMTGGCGADWVLLLLLPHPANPNIAPSAIPRQKIPALLPTFALLNCS